MLKANLIFLILLLSLVLTGQAPVGSWTDHLSYASARRIAIGNNEIYASTGYSVMIYDKTYSELRKLSRIQGLTETGISSMAFSKEHNTLILSYSSCNIDLVKNNTVYNIPDIKRKYMPGRKVINKVVTSGRYAYFACSFGIVVIDLVKNEIYDTWKPGINGNVAEVFDISFLNNKIYAATSLGVYSADASSTSLSYYGNWNLIRSLRASTSSYNAVISSGNKIYVNRNESTASGDSVYVVDNNAALFSFQSGIYNTSLDTYPGGFIISSPKSVRIYNDTGTLLRTLTSFSTSVPDISQTMIDGNDIWVADKSSGLFRGINMANFTSMQLPGPATNDVVSITNKNGKTYIAGGALDASWNNRWMDLKIFIYEDNTWHSEVSDTFKDALRVLPDPDNNNHYFVSTWGMGLLEYENNVLIKKYDDSNSPLKTIIAGAPYSRICGMAMDKSKNLWITQTGVPGTIKVLKPDGNWMPVNETISLTVPTVGDIMISKAGYKWVILPRGYGLFVLDDNNTPENFTDDRYKSFFIKDNDGNMISTVYSMAEDLDGNIWIGTDQGPVIYYNQNQIFDADPKAYRVILPRNDGTGLGDYLLKSESITSIAIDGANRKWLGTNSSGVYLVSSDGLKQLANYTEDNSPLYSNTIVGIAVDDKNGEVWIGTSKGVISIRGDATSGEGGFKKVYAFPNPVRPDYKGNLTITGLVRDTQVKITDVSGNLVFETISTGGQASWDLTTFTGSRVSSGVYIILCASSDGSVSATTKILVMK